MKRLHSNLRVSHKNHWCFCSTKQDLDTDVGHKVSLAASISVVALSFAHGMAPRLCLVLLQQIQVVVNTSDSWAPSTFRHFTQRFGLIFRVHYFHLSIRPTAFWPQLCSTEKEIASNGGPWTAYPTITCGCSPACYRCSGGGQEGHLCSHNRLWG
jgi:hypothetical protein